MNELYAEWQRLNDMVKAKSKALKKYPTGDMGLVPYNIRQSPEYIETNNQYKVAFQKLRMFNGNLTRAQKQALHKIRTNKKHAE